jgi:hypothetical protein
MPVMPPERAAAAAVPSWAGPRSPAQLSRQANLKPTTAGSTTSTALPSRRPETRVTEPGPALPPAASAAAAASALPDGSIVPSRAACDRARRLPTPSSRRPGGACLPAGQFAPESAAAAVSSPSEAAPSSCWQAAAGRVDLPARRRRCWVGARAAAQPPLPAIKQPAGPSYRRAILPP